MMGCKKIRTLFHSIFLPAPAAYLTLRSLHVLYFQAHSFITSIERSNAKLSELIRVSSVYIRCLHAKVSSAASTCGVA